MVSFHVSRWKFWWGYALIIVLAILTMWLNDNALDSTAKTVGVITIIMLVFFEVKVRKEQVKVTSAGLVYWTGKKARKVPFSKVGHITFNQSSVQQALGYGDVLVKVSHDDELVLSEFQTVAKLERAIRRGIEREHKGHAHAKR